MNLERLQSSLKAVELTADEQKTLTWLAGWDSHTTENVVSIISKARQAERSCGTDAGCRVLTRKDLLAIWGYLLCLKDIYEEKARDLAQREDDIGRSLTADYMKQAAQVRAMQKKVDEEAGEE